MNSKQLANLLTKMLGFSMGIYAVPFFMLGLISVIYVSASDYPPSGKFRATWESLMIRQWGLVGSNAVQAVFAILLIVKSEWVVGKLFPTESAPTPPPPGVP